MFDIQNLVLFAAAGLALNLTPGPDMLYCATRAASQGRAAGVLSAIGGGVGGLVHTVAAAFGLSALLTYSSGAFLIVKYAGVVFLVYIGIQMIRSPQAKLDTNRVEFVPNWKLFSQGALTTILNPKVAIFFLSFLPQFVDPARGSVTTQFLLLGLIFCTTGTMVNASVGLLFGYFGVWLERKPLFWKLQRRLAGSILVGLGLLLALPERR
jgi:threonine/homoserine/homoserine lactone efflux protein